MQIHYRQQSSKYHQHRHNAQRLVKYQRQHTALLGLELKHQLGADLSITTNLSTYTIWSFWGKVYSSYIDPSYHMFILAILNTPAANLNINYIKLYVAHP